MPWLAEERAPATHALAAVALRRLAWPDILLAFDEPDLQGQPAARWPYLVSLALAIAGPAALVLRHAADLDAAVHAAETTRAAASVAAEIAEAPGHVLERAAIADHAEALLAAAEATLSRSRRRRLVHDPRGAARRLGDRSPGRRRRRGADGAVRPAREQWRRLRRAPADARELVPARHRRPIVGAGPLRARAG